MKPKPIPGNPLGLNVKSELPANITKGALAAAVMPEGAVYDYALPQEWLDQFHGDDYERILCNCVTYYPPEHHIFGCVVDLVTGNVYPL